MITILRCWCCDTEYNYSKKEYCPICEAHWSDGRNAPNIIRQLTEEGDRVSVQIDYESETFQPLFV